MSRLFSYISDVFRSVADAFRSTRAQYEGSDRFARARFWVLVLLTVDVCAALLLFLSIGSRAADIEVSYQADFPTGLIMVRSRESVALESVKVRVDGRYEAVIPKLRGGGLRSLHLRREFRDEARSAPPRGYVPSRAEVEVDGETIEYQLGGQP